MYIYIYMYIYIAQFHFRSLWNVQLQYAFSKVNSRLY